MTEVWLTVIAIGAPTCVAGVLAYVIGYRDGRAERELEALHATVDRLEEDLAGLAEERTE